MLNAQSDCLKFETLTTEVFEVGIRYSLFDQVGSFLRGGGARSAVGLAHLGIDSTYHPIKGAPQHGPECRAVVGRVFARVGDVGVASLVLRFMQSERGEDWRRVKLEVRRDTTKTLTTVLTVLGGFLVNTDVEAYRNQV